MNLYDLDTPALIVDLDRLERNIARMAEIARAGGKRLRPHTKTHKTPEIARMQVEAGAVGLTVAKLGEAEVLADHGFTDLFVANQIVGAPKAERLIALLKRANATVGVDGADGARALHEHASRAGVRIPVRMEIDTGHHRAGVRDLEQAVALGEALLRMDSVALRGIYTHEGHLYKLSGERQAAAAAEAARLMREVADALRALGAEIDDISMGSTPGAPLIAGEPGITELRPGVYVVQDRMQVGIGSAEQDQCALTVLATVTSRPDDVTALVDAGTKSMSGDKAPSPPSPLPPAGEGSHGLVTDDPTIIFDWASEEHGHLDLTNAAMRPRVGQKLRIVPWHACACVNMHERIVAVRGERVEAVWTVAGRGRIQ
jgi:D-serine deaminase-like pyridoxal phosphate-dependent protein